MWNGTDDKTLLKQFGKYATTAGIIFLLLGVLGIFFPGIMSIAVVFFVGWIMVLAGLLAGYFTYMTDRGEWLGWLKAFILLVTGLLLVLYPMPGIAAIGLLLALYLLMDAFGSAAIGFSVKPMKGWWLWIVNALLSLVLAIIFIVGWPFSSLWLVGLFIGISLFFDGAVLISMGRVFKELDEDVRDDRGGKR